MPPRKYKIYPEHPCIKCTYPTTNKSYCTECLRLLTKNPRTSPRSNTALYSDRVKGIGRRLESANKLEFVGEV